MGSLETISPYRSRETSNIYLQLTTIQPNQPTTNPPHQKLTITITIHPHSSCSPSLANTDYNRCGVAILKHCTVHY
jgi:hypothetical protein